MKGPGHLVRAQQMVEDFIQLFISYTLRKAGLLGLLKFIDTLPHSSFHGASFWTRRTLTICFLGGWSGALSSAFI